MTSFIAEICSQRSLTRNWMCNTTYIYQNALDFWSLVSAYISLRIECVIPPTLSNNKRLHGFRVSGFFLSVTLVTNTALLGIVTNIKGCEHYGALWITSGAVTNMGGRVDREFGVFESGSFEPCWYQDKYFVVQSCQKIGTSICNIKKVYAIF